MRFSLRTCLEVLFAIAAALALWRAYNPPVDAIKVGDLLEISVVGTLIGQPIQGVHQVNELGAVDLGPAYGSVSVARLRLQGAKDVILKHLKKSLSQPELSLTRVRDDKVLNLQAKNIKLQDENERLRGQLQLYRQSSESK